MRVGALFATRKQNKVVELFGYGELLDDEIPESAVGPLADLTRLMRRPNPKIQLDSGLVVWGCECWWGPEEDVKAQVERYEKKGWTVKNVNVEEIRAAYRAAPTEGETDANH